MPQPSVAPTPPNKNSLRVVLVTCPKHTLALNLSKQLVALQLAACVNVVQGVTSVYQWEGTLHEDSETLLIIKTTEASVPSLTEWLAAQHPYSCPEIIALPIVGGFEPYLRWVTEQVVGELSTPNIT